MACWPTLGSSVLGDAVATLRRSSRLHQKVEVEISFHACTVPRAQQLTIFFVAEFGRKMYTDYEIMCRVRLRLFPGTRWHSTPFADQHPRFPRPLLFRPSPLLRF